MLIAIHKPWGVLCQFSGDDGRPTLNDLVTAARAGGHVHGPGITDAAWRTVYPAGRLDRDSEGLLLLSDDGALIHRISDPRHKWPKVYWVQVENQPDPAQREALANGVMLNDGPTLPARVRLLEDHETAGLWPRDPPIRVRQSIPTAWLEIELREGRNRQVRRMTAAVGLPTLRLVRMAIGPHRLDGLEPGHVRVLEATPAPVREPRERSRPRQGHQRR